MARALRAGVALAMVAASACGGDSRDVVQFQVFGDGAEVAAYRSLIAAFERQDGRARVELVAVPSQSDHMAKLSTSFAAGNPPDLFLVNYRRFGQFAAKGVLRPLRPDDVGLRATDFYAEALDAFAVSGVQTCLPQNISSLVVYYNRALFRQAGVAEPKAGWRWDDFLAAAKAITRDTDGDGDTDVYGVGTEPNLIRLAPFVWQAGGEVVDQTHFPTRMTLTGDATVRAMKFFIELRRVHRVAPSQQEAASQDLETRFAAGTLGMMLDSRRATTSLRQVEDLDWDVAPLPREREAATILHGDAYCTPKQAREPDAAARFVGFALSEEGQRLMARTGRIVPSLRTVSTSDAFLDSTQPPRNARVWLDQIPLIRRVPNIAAWHEIETKADVRVEEWYYGTEPAEALGIEIDFDTRQLFVARP